MKNLILIILFSAIFNNKSLSQVIKPGIIVSSEKIKYEVSATNPSKTILKIQRQETKLKSMSSTLTPKERENIFAEIAIYDKKISRDITNILSNSLGPRYQQLKGNKIHITYFIDSQGKIKELQYLLNAKSKLTPDDLSQIEKSITNSYMFDFIKKSNMNFNFLTFTKSHIF